MSFEELKLGGVEQRIENPEKAFEIAQSGYQDRLLAWQRRRQLSLMKELGLQEDSNLSGLEMQAKIVEERANKDEFNTGLNYDMAGIDKLDHQRLFDLELLINDELEWLNDDRDLLNEYKERVDEAHKELYDSKMAALGERLEVLMAIKQKIESLRK